MVNFDNIIIETTGPIEMLLTKHTSLCMKIHCVNKSGIHVELIVICFKKSCTPTQGASMGVRKIKLTVMKSSPASLFVGIIQILGTNIKHLVDC